MSLHVCFLCNEYPPEPHGGVGATVQALGRGLVARGHAVTVLGVSADHPGTADDHGVSVVRLPHARVRGTGFLVHGRRVRRALREVHRSRPIDIVEAPELGLAILPRRHAAISVIRMHGGHHFFAATLGEQPRPWRSWLERRSFARADHLCAVSQFVATTTRDLLGLGDRAITVVPNGVDTDLFHPSDADPDPRRVLFVGTVCEKKGVQQLLEAMPAVLAAHPDTRLVVAGRDWVGPDGTSFTDELLAGAAADLGDHVRFIGPVDHDAVPALLATAVVCVFPSHMEAMPVAWLEAMACGRAIVASSTGPGPEVIDHGETGLLCDPTDPEAIAESVSYLLDDPARRTHLGAAARQRALDSYSIDALVDRTEGYYLTCLARGRP